MTRRYRGSFITANPPIPDGPFQNSVATGIWSMAYQAQYKQQGLWPLAGNPGDGAFAIFTLGALADCCATTTRRKYTYSSCTEGSAGAATNQSYFGSAAGNATVGIFALGRALCYVYYCCCIPFYVYSTSTTRNKYTYSSCAVGSATAATASTQYGSATGNSTVGIFALGQAGIATTTRNKYTYSGDVVSAGGSATSQSRFGSAAGTSAVGIFALGSANCGTRFDARNKYTYSGDTVTSATAATTGSALGSATGNTTTGIFALGNTSGGNVTTRNKYTYSGDVVSTGGAATVASSSGSAAGNSTRGIFALGFTGAASTTRNKYTYAGDVVSAGGSAVFGAFGGSATGSGTAGVNT